MRRAGGEGLVPPLCRADLQNGSHNEDVGDGDQGKGNGKDDNTDNEDHGFLHSSISTGQPQDREYVTVEVCDPVVATKWQVENQSCEL